MLLNPRLKRAGARIFANYSSTGIFTTWQPALEFTENLNRRKEKIHSDQWVVCVMSGSVICVRNQLTKEKKRKEKPYIQMKENEDPGPVWSLYGMNCRELWFRLSPSGCPLLIPPYDAANRSSWHPESVIDEEEGGATDTWTGKGQTRRESPANGCVGGGSRVPLV